jgi:enoyl-CoA hydratase/carnithine racemase
MTYVNITAEVRGKVGLITLNRPKQLNALNDDLMDELGKRARRLSKPTRTSGRSSSPARTRPSRPAPTSP